MKIPENSVFNSREREVLKIVNKFLKNIIIEFFMNRILKQCCKSNSNSAVNLTQTVL